MSNSKAAKLESLFKQITISFPPGCPEYEERQWDNNLRSLLSEARQTARLCGNYEAIAYIRFQEGLYHLQNLDYGYAREKFLRSYRNTIKAQNPWLACLSILAQGVAEFEAKQYQKSIQLFKRTKACINELRNYKLVERGFYHQENKRFIYLDGVEKLLQSEMKACKNAIKKSTTSRLL